MRRSTVCSQQSTVTAGATAEAGRLLLVLLIAGAAGVSCASAPADAVAQTPPPADQTALLVPPGYGQLRQDEITVSLRNGPLLIKVTPLDEGVIRLLAPDRYDALHRLVESRRAEAATQAAVDAPELFLVSFFSYEPDIVFQPEDLQLTYQGKILRAAAMLPMTTGFGRQRLQQQENQSAIYAFAERIDYGQPFVVRYGFQQSDEWLRILPKLEVERGKVRARAKG
jgi:hypothetical protein